MDVMMDLTKRVAAAIVASVVLVSAAILAAPGAKGDDLIVNCFDPARNIVQKTRRGDCGGTIVSPDEAAKIEAERREYVRRAFVEPTVSFGEGRRLRGIGTGFFVSRDGMLVTNRHVVGNCDAVSVSTTSGETAAAQLESVDVRRDLALLHVDLTPTRTARIVPGGAWSGSVALVGYPDQGIPPIKPLLTEGRVIGTEQLTPDLKVIKIAADVRPGNSGGPLLDQRGNVVGVVFAEINTPKIFKSTGKVVRDVGYVIPSEALIEFLDSRRIPYWRAGSDTGASLGLLAAASPYIARVGCWR